MAQGKKSNSKKEMTMHSTNGNGEQIVLAVIQALSDQGCRIPSITPNLVEKTASRLERELWALVPQGAGQ